VSACRASAASHFSVGTLDRRHRQQFDTRLPMSLLVALVRHGLTDWNEQGRVMGRCDVALNERGQAQAAAAASALATPRLDTVLASPQRRAQETASAIAAPHGLPVTTEEDLAEVWVGRWQGHSFEELREDPDVAHYLRDASHRCEAIEGAASVQRRVVAVLDRLRAGAPRGRACVVSHGDPIRLLLAHCLDTPLAGFRRLHVAPGSISIVRLSGRQPQVLGINWRAGSPFDWA
jgi:probable phosphoglycerate mutase